MATKKKADKVSKPKKPRSKTTTTDNTGTVVETTGKPIPLAKYQGE